MKYAWPYEKIHLPTWMATISRAVSPRSLEFFRAAAFTISLISCTNQTWMPAMAVVHRSPRANSCQYGR